MGAGQRSPPSVDASMSTICVCPSSRRCESKSARAEEDERLRNPSSACTGLCALALAGEDISMLKRADDTARLRMAADSHVK